MTRETINAICETFPGAELSDPWGGGHDAWKVGGKMFACIGAVMPGVSVKTDSIETAEMLIEMGVGVKAPYFHRSWLTLPFDTPEEELRGRLAASYRLVRAGLTKKAQAALRALWCVQPFEPGPTPPPIPLSTRERGRRNAPRHAVVCMRRRERGRDGGDRFMALGRITFVRG